MSTKQVIGWLQSDAGQQALAHVKSSFPNFSRTHAGHVGFTLGMYAKQISNSSLDKANVEEIVRAVFGETDAAVRGRKGGTAASDAKAQAARNNGRKGGRPKKPTEGG